jgi:hypothetical protein
MQSAAKYDARVIDGIGFASFIGDFARFEGELQNFGFRPSFVTIHQ